MLTQTDNTSRVFLYEEVAAILVLVGTAALVFVVGWLLLRAGKLPHPGSLVIALSTLAAIALVGYIMIEAEPLVTVAGTAVGALAAAVANVYKENHHDDRDTDT